MARLQQCYIIDFNTVDRNLRLRAGCFYVLITLRTSVNVILHIVLRNSKSCDQDLS
jgi:hypothetical protein